MKKFLLFVLLLIGVATLKAQENIREQIENYKTPKSELIAKGRQLLLDKFMANDIKGAKQLADYIADSLADTDYMGLWLVEKILIDYWANDYQAVLNETLKFDMVNRWQGITQLAPLRDFLYKNLLETSTENYDNLANAIDRSEFLDEDKAFLHMYLRYMLLNDDNLADREAEQESLNTQAATFIAAYPQSRYTDIVKQQIREKYVKSKWGWGIEFFSGYGIFTNDLRNTFRNPVPFGVSFDVAYTKFTGYFRIYCGFSQTKQDIYFRSNNNEYIWEDNSQAILVIPEFSLGYAAYENKRVQISPFASVGAANIGPVSDDMNKNDALNDADITSFTYGVGVNFDLKFGQGSNLLNLYSNYGMNDSYWLIRLRYSFNRNNFKGYSGNFHNITVGIGGFTRNMKRKLD